MKPKVGLRKIVGKKAYIGRHTFEAHSYGTGINICIYRNCPRKFESSILAKNISDLIQLSQEKTSIKLFYGEMKDKEQVEKFLEFFKY